jgi:hypothetical protein
VPQVLVLNDCGIDQAGAAEDLKKKCNSVKELDLAQNRLENWDEVMMKSETDFHCRRCNVRAAALTYIFTLDISMKIFS